MDRISPEQRQRLMSRVRQKNTKPEVMVRSILHRQGFRFRLHNRKLPGTPDIVLPRHSSVVFVNGCFWHGHDCPRGSLPATRRDFWQSKITKNQLRDARNHADLKAIGYQVITVWECELRDIDALAEKLTTLITHGKGLGNASPH